MSEGFRLLRAEYIFSVIIPCLLCIYLNYNMVSALNLFKSGLISKYSNDFITLKPINQSTIIDNEPDAHGCDSDV